MESENERGLPVRFKDQCHADHASTWLANQLSAETVRAYRADVTQFIERFQVSDPGEISTALIICWRDELRARGLSSATIARKLSSISSLLGWMAAEGVIVGNPALRVRFPRVSSEGRRKALSAMEARALLDLPREPLHRAIIGTLLYTGIRRGELVKLKIGDIQNERGHVVLEVQGKGGKRRRIPLHPEAYQLIREYLESQHRRPSDRDAPLFASPRWREVNQETALSANTIWTIVKRYSEKLGIPRSPHDARSTAASIALERGASVGRVCYAFGWSSASMAMRYQARKDQLENSAIYKINYHQDY